MAENFNNLIDSMLFSQTELHWRNDHLCRAPFSGFCLDASGTITLCCMASSNKEISYFPNKKWPKIQDIKDLTEFYNSEQMEHFRKELENENGSKLSPCDNCFRLENLGQKTFRNIINDEMLIRGFDDDWDARDNKEEMKIRWLELTTSNLCNATCSTCNPFFSHKWNDVYKFFKKEKLDPPFWKTKAEDLMWETHPVLRLKEKDIEKIEKILPDLSWLTLKGGEPFADKNNFRILKKLFDCNNHCAVTIISNFHKINPEMFKVLEKGRFQLTHVGASIDGIDKEYDWIRSNKFEDTINTLEQWSKKVRVDIAINVFVSFHNFFSLNKIVDYFKDKSYVNNINFTNAAISPIKFSLESIPRELILNNLKKYIDEWSLINDDHVKKKGFPLVDFSTLDNYYKTKKDTVTEHDIEKTIMEFKHIENMNKFRGFNLLDHCKGLKDLHGQIL